MISQPLVSLGRGMVVVPGTLRLATMGSGVLTCGRERRSRVSSSVGTHLAAWPFLTFALTSWPLSTARDLSAEMAIFASLTKDSLGCSTSLASTIS